MAILQNDWQPRLGQEFEEPYYKKLRSFLKEEYRTKTVYPDMYEIYSALHLTSFSDTRVVILGQDPYHGPGQAHGLSFSVKPGVVQPPSLQNIFKELHDDLGCPIPRHGHLVKWAEQGVLLLNTVLTVCAGIPNSHRGKGWEMFTDKVIRTLNERDEPVVFVLWGSHAGSKRQMIDTSRHHVIQSPHPSPLSAYRGFFGSKPFSRANRFLRECGREEVDWEIPDGSIL
jgi:uracil-DNA glycosylase